MAVHLSSFRVETERRTAESSDRLVIFSFSTLGPVDRNNDVSHLHQSACCSVRHSSLMFFPLSYKCHSNGTFHHRDVRHHTERIGGTLSNGRFTRHPDRSSCLRTFKTSLSLSLHAFASHRSLSRWNNFVGLAFVFTFLWKCVYGWSTSIGEARKKNKNICIRISKSKSRRSKVRESEADQILQNGRRNEKWERERHCFKEEYKRTNDRRRSPVARDDDGDDGERTRMDSTDDLRSLWHAMLQLYHCLEQQLMRPLCHSCVLSANWEWSTLAWDLT